MKNNNDVSPFIALAIFIVVIIGMLSLYNQEFVIGNWDIIKHALLKSQNALFYLSVSLFVNFYVTCMIVERSLGYKKQGSKLRSIRKEEKNVKSFLLKASISILLVALLYSSNLKYITESTSGLKIILNEYYPVFFEAILLSSCLSYFLFLFWVVGIFGFLSKLVQGRRLPSFKEVENHLTLGTIGEEENNFEKKVKPKWAMIPQKALNGNILVTGSIGTGKTQGTILNFAEQLFGNNFHLTPSSLVLDPKGSFIPEIVNILKKRDELGDCVYLGDAHGNI